MLDLRKVEKIMGPPGTGKTTRLLGDVSNVLSWGCSPADLIYIAFTRKAASEAKSRAIEKLNLQSEELPWFRTIHSLAFQRMGKRRDQMMGLTDYFKICDMLGIRITFKGVQEDGTISGQSRGDRLFFMDQLARATMTPLKDYWAQYPDEDLTWHEVELLANTLQKYKQDTGKMDFTDLLYAFIEHGDVPDHQFLFVDEAQDLSPLQWAVVHKVAEKSGRIYIAGDDDQAIFRWAGAHVDYFIDMAAKTTVLTQSHRVPAEVNKIALDISGRIHHRVNKAWKPREAAGSVEHVTALDQINMDQGSWLLLARNAYLLQSYNDHCLQMGYVFDSSLGSPVRGNTMIAIRAWEDLRKGMKVRARHAKRIYELLSVGPRVTYGFKTKLEQVPDENLLVMQDLREKFGLILGVDQLIWHEALDKITDVEREYFIAARRRGEKLLAEPRIKISTIHGVKGGEAENVVLMTDMAFRTHQEYMENPDDEHRVWYVGVTRAKERLFIIQPNTRMFYAL